ncbi:C4-dicarboxylate transport transcriptional regulatory protein DctD [compost metagenome]
MRRALALRRLVLDNRSLRLALSDRNELSTRLVGQSPSMLRLREQIGALAATKADVLILGETGAGKEVVARALHDLSSRRNGPFVAINAGALAESVVESELFGHEPGAFTGAQKRRIGKFEFANGGTLFLDEIESMSLDVQVKLLRLLQERVVERLGGNQLIPLDIRIIAATKEDLRQSADQGRFRADLYYRLNVAPLRIPPLRERGEDALVLFQHFADEASGRHGLPPHELQPGQRALLLRHTWPGNVRELQNAAERFALGLELALDNNEPQDAAGTVVELVSGGLSEQVENFEKTLIAAELARSHSSVRSVAEALGIPRKTLHDKLRKHGLSFADSGAASHSDDLD